MSQRTLDPHPTRDDLTPDWQHRLDAAYAARERVRCSEEDFTAGYLAALVDTNSFVAFRLRPDQEHPDAG